MTATRRSRRLGVAALALALCLVFMVVASARPAAAIASPLTPPTPALQADDGKDIIDDGKDIISDSVYTAILGPSPGGGMDTAPLSHYHIYFDDGSRTAGPLPGGGILGLLSSSGVPGALAAAPDEERTSPSSVSLLVGTLTEGVFTAGRWTAGLGIGVLSLVYESRLRAWVNGLVRPAAKVADDINRKIVGPLNLAGLGLLLALLYAGWQTFRGRAPHGVSELLLSLVIYAVAITALSDPVNGFLRAANGVTDIAAQVLTIPFDNGVNIDKTGGGSPATPRCPSLQQTTGQPGASGNFGHQGAGRKNQEGQKEGLNASDQTGVDRPMPTRTPPLDSEPIECAFRVLLVEIPYNLINYGEDIKPGDPCWKNRQAVLTLGPGAGAGDTVAGMLGKDGCKLKLSSQPSMDRLLATVLYVLAVLGIIGPLTSFSLMVFIALLSAIFQLKWVWVMFALGLVPGAPRRMFWRYVTIFWVAIAAVIVMSAFLAVLVWGSLEAMNLSDGMPMAFRFLLMIIVGITLLKLRRTMLHRSVTWVRSMGDRMPGARAALAGAGGGGAGGGAGGGMIQWGGHPGRPRPGVDGPGITPWIHPAIYRSPRFAGPHELGAQVERRGFEAPAARPVVRARRGLTYPIRHPVRTALAPLWVVRHPVRTVTAPFRAVGNAVIHPVQTARRPFRRLPRVDPRNPDWADYPDRRHPWLPD